LKITDLIISPASFGSKFWLVDVMEVHEYRDNKRTDNVTGFKYTVALPERGLEKIAVKIDGRQLLDKPDSGGYLEVTFEHLEPYIYWLNSQPQVGARASSVALVNRKT